MNNEQTGRLIHICAWCNQDIQEDDEVFGFGAKASHDIDLSDKEGEFVSFNLALQDKTVFALVPASSSSPKSEGFDFMFLTCARGWHSLGHFKIKIVSMWRNIGRFSGPAAICVCGNHQRCHLCPDRVHVPGRALHRRRRGHLAVTTRGHGHAGYWAYPRLIGRVSERRVSTSRRTDRSVSSTRISTMINAVKLADESPEAFQEYPKTLGVCRPDDTRAIKELDVKFSH